MEYIELSLKSVKEKVNELNEIIVRNNYKYDLVIFIAKGSYPIAKSLSDNSGVPLLEISATRKGGKIKKILKPFMRIVPKKILISLRKNEMNSTYHEKNNERNIVFSEKKYQQYKNCKKILLVDDSIDSGHSIIEVRKELEKFFDNVEIKVAVFNVMNKSTIKPEFTLYEDTMICGPWSSDSKYYNTFIKEYKEWKKEYER